MNDMSRVCLMTNLPIMWPILAITLFLAGVTRADVQAAEPVSVDANRHAATIAPFLDDETILVAHFDLARIDAAAALRWIGKLAPVPLESRSEFEVRVTGIEVWIKSLSEAGVGHTYVVLSLADVPQAGPFIVVSIAENGNVNRITELLSQGPSKNRQEWRQTLGNLFQKITTFNNNVVAGPTRVINRLKVMQPAERRDLVNALAAGGDTTAQVVFTLGDDQRRALREMLPAMSKEWGQISGPILADGVQWAALGVNLPPVMSASLVIQSNDAAAATALQQTIVTSLRSLGKMPEVQKAFPQYDELRPLIEPRVDGNQITVTLTAEDGRIPAVVELVKKPIVNLLELDRRHVSINNLKQLALAMHNYADVNKHFPPAGNVDDKGNKLLSWRVHVLPFLEQNNLYKQFHLDEPWDSEHNRQLIDKMPALFASPGSGLHKKQMANYLVPVGESLAFTGGEGIPIKEFTDGTSNIIMIVEVDPSHAVIWTKPDDLQVVLEHPFRGLLSERRKMFLAAFADAHVEGLAKQHVSAEKLRALFTRNGGEVIQW